MVDTGQAWTVAVVALGGDPTRAGATALDLVARYREGHRHYHTLSHIEATLDAAQWLSEVCSLAESDRSAVDVAVCAHDVVYEGRPGHDEVASGEWARRSLEYCGLAADPISKVVDAVEATATHRPRRAGGVADGVVDEVATVLLDADLAILAAPPDIYQGYVSAVRREYAHLDDRTWRDGRRSVLGSLLAHDPIFSTEAGRERWEDAARRNLIDELRAQGPADD